MTEQRQGDRDSVFLLAGLRFLDQEDALRVKVRNLSPGGMMAECPVQVARGDRLKIDLRNVGWINGTVTWVSDNRFGVVFEREIDCKAVRQPVAIGGELSVMGARRPPPPPEPRNLRRI